MRGRENISIELDKRRHRGSILHVLHVYQTCEFFRWFLHGIKINHFILAFGAGFERNRRSRNVFNEQRSEEELKFRLPSVRGPRTRTSSAGNVATDASTAENNALEIITLRNFVRSGHATLTEVRHRANWHGKSATRKSTSIFHVAQTSKIVRWRRKSQEYRKVAKPTRRRENSTKVVLPS